MCTFLTFDGGLQDIASLGQAALEDLMQALLAAGGTIQIK
jgi:hypothetical protein